MAVGEGGGGGWLGERSVAFWTVTASIAGVIGLFASLYFLIWNQDGQGNEANQTATPTDSGNFIEPMTSTPPASTPGNPPSSADSESESAKPSGPVYLSDMDFEVPDSVTLGLAFLGGKKYSHSISQSICINDAVTVDVPPGYQRFHAFVGFNDKSFSHPADHSAVIAVSMDPPGDDRVWRTLDSVPLSTRKLGKEMTEDLPAGVTAVALYFEDYACSTEAVWADPAFE